MDGLVIPVSQEYVCAPDAHMTECSPKHIVSGEAETVSEGRGNTGIVRITGAVAVHPVVVFVPVTE
jgi:hypothetical protein